MNHSFIHRIQEHITERSILSQNEKILVAVSGGIDSVVLFHALFSLKEKLQYSLAIAHYNFCLRGKESDEDEVFVKTIAEKYNIPFFAERENLLINSSASIQERARELRYNFFQQIANKFSYTKIATGHNENDNVETVLFNFFRGSGVRGLSGIPIQRENIIRPLLICSRKEIEDYANENQLSFRTDSSNEKNIYSRNVIRNVIIPEVEETINANVRQTLERTSLLFSDLENYLQYELKKLSKLIIVSNNDNESIISLPILLSQPKFLQEYFFYNFLSELLQKEISHSLIDNVTKFCKNETGSTLSIGENISLLKNRDHLIFSKSITESNEFCYSIELNKHYDFRVFMFRTEVMNEKNVSLSQTSAIEFIDADLLNEELCLRNWSVGDYFYPLGMNGKKKVSDFFIDEKVSRFEKYSIPILETNGKIIWICGKRIDNRFKITEKTKRIAKLEFKNLLNETYSN